MLECDSKLTHYHPNWLNFNSDNYPARGGYKDTLLSGFQMLADNPGLGRSCDEVYPNGFYFPIGKHTAYFTKEDGFILVVAVLGQSQLPQNHLK
ncbi:type II toxin-antitoxin system RelE/ParE family toxin [Vibrio vulnificus]|uniref:type II toxin-antitoxin system RelE/ParE family toxin n=1 Tax=Vibrio vulnificus TaxID=672 RepID=UPI003EDAB001